MTKPPKADPVDLSAIYKEGNVQPVDIEHANCFMAVARAIDPRLAPNIENLIEPCPPR